MKGTGMKQQKLKMAACAMAATMAFTGLGTTAYAAGGITNVLPSAGVTLTLGNSDTTLQTIKDSVISGENAGTIDTSSIEAKQIEETQKVSELVTAAPEEVEEMTEEQKEEETFKSLVIARVTNYVNVRDIPSEDGEVVGKLYDKSVGTFISEENGWYQINSGSVTGYVKAEYCVTGDEAVELAKQVGTRIATVNTTTLKVRTEPGLDAPVLGLVPIDDDLIVTEEVEGWVKVNIEEGDGYVSTDYVNLTTEFVQAESKAEEEARLAKEEAERKAAQAAAAAAQASRAASTSETTTQAPATTATASGGSETGNSVANYALQFVGNPYVYGGSSLTNGTDCSGFVMSVYANYGVSLPHSSSSLRSSGSSVEGGLSAAQAGDIVCYSGHVGLYIGNGQIVHASTAKTGIIVSNADYRQVLAVRRIF